MYESLTQTNTKMLIRYKLYSISLLFLLSGCNVIDDLLNFDEESSGTCYAESEMITENGIIDPGGTHFFRDDQVNLVEHAFVEIHVISSTSGNTILAVDAHFRDMPSSTYVGTHSLVDNAYIDKWDVFFPTNTIVLGDSFTFSSASRQKIKGVFTILYQNNAPITCDVVLGRKYSLDTDDGNDHSIGGHELIDIIF